MRTGTWQTGAMSNAEFLIAGGGIAGLAAALAISPRSTLLLEQATEWSEVGAGLQLGPNAVRALQKLGVWDAVAPYASSPPEIHVHDGMSGMRIARWQIGPKFEQRFGAPYRVAHRADLHKALLECTAALPHLEIRMAHPITAMGQSAENVWLSSQSTKISAKSLIAADGIKSSIRSQLLPGSIPVNTGYIYHRALLDYLPQVSGIAIDCVNLWLCPEAHVVHYPVGKRARLNLVAVTREDKTPQSAFERASGTLKDILAQPKQWLPWPSIHVPVLKSSAHGNTLLIGDAAHGTVPYLAQGAAMALEDAAALKDNPHNFCAVSRIRASRVLRLHKASIQQGQIYHASGLKRWAALQAIARTPEHLVWSRLSWLYGK